MLAYDYWRLGLTQAEIAEKYGVDRTTVLRLMKKWNIPARKPHEYTLQQRINIITKRKAQTRKLLDEVLATESREFRLTPDYIVGLVDGEGSFSICLDFRFSPPSAYCDFSVSNSAREILIAIKDFFGFGLVAVGHSRKGRRTVYSYSVNAIRQQLKLAKFFIEHPLSIKAHAFRCWFRALQLIARNEHRTEQGFREIIWLKENINAHNI